MGILEDHSRFKDIVRGRIKENFKKYVSHGEMIGIKVDLGGITTVVVKETMIEGTHGEIHQGEISTEEGGGGEETGTAGGTQTTRTETTTRDSTDPTGETGGGEEDLIMTGALEEEDSTTGTTEILATRTTGAVEAEETETSVGGAGKTTPGTGTVMGGQASSETTHGEGRRILGVSPGVRTKGETLSVKIRVM